MKHIHVPHYEGLSFQDIFSNIRDLQQVMAFLPCEKEIYQLPKQYLANITYSVVGEDFSKWIDQKVEERNHKVAVERSLFISLDPAIAHAFRESTHVSM